MLPGVSQDFVVGAVLGSVVGFVAVATNLAISCLSCALVAPFPQVGGEEQTEGIHEEPFLVLPL